jgi:hypothetical protein
MPIIFNPSGKLDVATDAADLPEQVQERTAVSGAMRRCTNLHLEQQGRAVTRGGAAKVNYTPLATGINRIICQGADRYAFAGGTIYRQETSLETGLILGDWSAALYAPFNMTVQTVYCLNGSNRKKIEGDTVYEWGLTAPASAPGVSSGGSYEVVYTYARYDGDILIAESDPSPAALAGLYPTVTWPAAADPQITHVRIYRSLITTAGIWYFESRHAVGDLTATLTLADEALGAQVATNHDRPPLGTTVLGPSFGGQLFILHDNFLYYSLPQQPEYWPPNYFLEVTPPQYPLMAGAFFGGNLLVASEHEIFLISGTSAASYFAQPMSAATGTRSRNCFVSIKGHGIFHLGSDGVYLYSAGKDESITDMEFWPIFQGTAQGSIPGLNRDRLANCLMALWENKLWFGYPALGETWCRDWLVRDLETGRTVHYQFPFAARSLSVDNHNKRLLVGDADGYIWDVQAGAATDEDTDISWDLASKEFVQFPMYFPRYARWDVTLGTGAAATGEVRLGDTVHQTHVLSVSRRTRKRLVEGAAGTRLNVRVYGTGPVEVHGVEVE